MQNKFTQSFININLNSEPIYIKLFIKNCLFYATCILQRTHKKLKQRAQFNDGNEISKVNEFESFQMYNKIVLSSMFACKVCQEFGRRA